MITEIPSIDLAGLTTSPAHRQRITDAITASCRDIGFFTLTGSGVPRGLIDDMHALMPLIFGVDDDAKWDQAITRDNYRGYIPFGFFRANGTTEAPDRYEGFKLHRDTAHDDPIVAACGLYGPNRWPREVPQSRGIILDYWAALDRLTLTLLGLLEDGLRMGQGALTAAMDNPLTNMTLLHYPAQKPDEPGFGIHPHKDTDVLTIIAPDPVGGLEVRTPDGRWIEPRCPDGGVVVNIGDMLELWSGGRLVSTPHRVINRSGQERYSFPYFAVPRHDVVITPLLPPVEGFDRPAVHCGHWSQEIWRTNWPDQHATGTTPELGTITDG